MKFRFQDNNDIAKACALSICVQRTGKCAPEVSCGFTFLDNISNPFTTAFNDSNKDTLNSQSCNWTWTVHNPQQGIFDVILHNKNPVKHHITQLTYSVVDSFHTQCIG